VVAPPPLWPSAAWLTCAAIAHNLLRTAGSLASLAYAKARGATLRRDLIDVAARLIAPGSALVISCATYDDEALAKRLAAEYTAGQFVNHAREDVVSFFAGLELVGPGVREAQTWRPWMPSPVLRRREGHVLAGVARCRA